MTHPRRVRCSPLHREERVAEVADVELRPNRQLIYSVLVDGHRFAVDAADTMPVDED